MRARGCRSTSPDAPATRTKRDQNAARPAVARRSWRMARALCSLSAAETRQLSTARVGGDMAGYTLPCAVATPALERRRCRCNPRRSSPRDRRSARGPAQHRAAALVLSGIVQQRGDRGVLVGAVLDGERGDSEQVREIGNASALAHLRRVHHLAKSKARVKRSVRIGVGMTAIESLRFGHASLDRCLAPCLGGTRSVRPVESLRRLMAVDSAAAVRHRNLLFVTCQPRTAAGSCRQRDGLAGAPAPERAPLEV